MNCKEVYNPKLAFNHQDNQVELVVSESSLLASKMVEQPIIQAVVSSVEIFDDT